MPRRRPLLPFLLSLAVPAGLAGTTPAAAFHVGASPDFPACSIWFNDDGKPLRNKLGREIGQEVPCAGQAKRHDTYKVYAGEAHNTLVIRDQTHHLECLMQLESGSDSVMVPTACRKL